MEKKIIRIKTIRTYTRTAVVEIEFPSYDDGHHIALDEVADYLNDNEHLYAKEMYKGLNDAVEECNHNSDVTYFDVVQTALVITRVWEGTL